MAAARARAALRSSSPEGVEGLRAASRRTALASSVRLVELEGGGRRRGDYSVNVLLGSCW